MTWTRLWPANTIGRAGGRGETPTGDLCRHLAGFRGATPPSGWEILALYLASLHPDRRKFSLL